MSCQIILAFLVAVLISAAAYDICLHTGTSFTLWTGMRFELNSPQHPSSYSNNLDCKIFITVPNTSLTRFTFTDFRTEPHDVLTIREGESEDGKLLFQHSGYGIPCTNFTASSNRLVIRFKTDSSVVETGFRMIITDITNRYQRGVGFYYQDVCSWNEAQDQLLESLSSKVDATKSAQDKQEQLIESLLPKLDEAKSAQVKHDQLLQNLSSQLNTAKSAQVKQDQLLQSLSSKLDETIVAFKELKSAMITKNEMLAMLSVMYDRR